MTPSHSPWLEAIAVAAILIAAGRPVAAQSSAGNGVILTAGEASMTGDVRAAAQTWLKGRGWNVSDGGLTKRAATKLAQCLAVDPDECAAALSEIGVDRVWFFLVEVEPADAGTNVQLVLRAFGRDGRVLASERKFCERCRTETLRARVAEALDVVSRAATAQTAARTVVRIRSVPSGAVVSVDGQQIGTTDREYAVYPGHHKVTLSKPGYQDAVRDLDLKEGEVKALDVQLTPVSAKPPAVQPAKPAGPPSAPPIPTTREGRGPWPYVVGGAGVALTASGVALLALHERRVQEAGQVFTYRDTLVPGVALTISGAAALVVSSYLLLRPDDQRQLTPIVTISGHEIGLGFSGGF